MMDALDIRLWSIVPKKFSLSLSLPRPLPTHPFLGVPVNGYIGRTCKSCEWVYMVGYFLFLQEQIQGIIIILGPCAWLLVVRSVLFSSAGHLRQTVTCFMTALNTCV